MKRARLIKTLRAFRSFQTDGAWLEENKRELFAFISERPVRRFQAIGMAEQRIDRASVAVLFGVRRFAVAAVLFVTGFALLGLGSGLFGMHALEQDFLMTVQTFGERAGCLLATDRVDQLKCEIAKAEQQLDVAQTLLELKGVGQNRERLELTLRSYTERLRKAEYHFVRLAAAEEDPQLILEAARQLERVKEHQQLIEAVQDRIGDELSDAVKEAHGAAVETSAQADKQILRVEAATAGEDATARDLASVQELSLELQQANSEILNLETVLATLSSYYGYVALLPADGMVASARNALSEARALVEEGKYIEAIDTLTIVSESILVAKAEIKKLEPNLNLNLEL